MRPSGSTNRVARCWLWTTRCSGWKKTDPQKGQLIEMRYFGGMTAEEIRDGAVLLPVHVVRRELRLAQAWLRKEIAGEDSSAASLPQPDRKPIRRL